MKRRLVISSAIASIALGFVVVSTARAQSLSSTLQPCQEGIAKAGLKFSTKKLKTIQNCIEKNLKAAGSCASGDLNTAIATLVTKFDADLSKKCASLPGAVFGNPRPNGLGFPGKCVDANPGDGFTFADVQSCMETSHENKVDGGNHTTPGVGSLIEVEFGGTTGPITDSATYNCQKTIAKDGGKVFKAVLQAVQKCRNAINKGQLIGVAPLLCATSDAKTADKIAKAESKATADITAKCTDAEIQALDVCNPAATTAAAAASCIVSSHHVAADDQSVATSGLAEFEYAEPPSCGDGILNQPTEECDGDADAACPGQCGAPGNFGCLCLNVPRERIIEHASADLDNGWSGQSHDSGVVEGGGYVVNLYDCDSDNTCGDHTCTIGRSCTGGAHASCISDSDCLLGTGPCRSDRTDVGPHCVLNPQVTCTTNAQCPGTGNSCLKTFHGPPLPLSAGGISVCVVNTFTENVYGTKDLATGAGAVRLRQLSTTNLSSVTAEPCPVCGGFCLADPNSGNRHLCSVDADCNDVPGSVHKCVTDPVCSIGPSADKLCRPDPPFGGPTTLFGNPSVDCQPTSNIIGQLDILFNPATTSTVSMLPSVQCDDPAFTGKTCSGGTNNGATCTNASECPGGGSCTYQCYCPNGGGQKQRPNACDAACVGGGSDAFPCDADSDCPGGFCHLADCRPDPGAPAILQPNEGGCTTTTQGTCSVSAFRTCSQDSDCQPPSCTFCQPTETCVITPKNCFINSGTTTPGIVRTGAPGPDDSVSAAVFCIAQTSASSVNSTAGLPGPGALIQPESTVHTGIIQCP